MKVIVIIPARLDSKRLKRKPLADINGKPMILRSYEQAVKANIGPVVVACCCKEIADVIENAGGRAIITKPDLPSGTDRIWAAFRELKEDYDVIVNYQGDIPFLEKSVLLDLLEPLDPSYPFSISSLASPISEIDRIENPNVVKVACSSVDGNRIGKALFFSRTPIPYGASRYYAHVGLYAFFREALQKFVQFPCSSIELIEKLEQLRAIENGLPIGIKLIDKIPMSVDTDDDLEKVRNFSRNLIV